MDIGIDELVLDGFPAGDRFRIADAVERELARLLREQGPPSLWAKDGDISRLEGVQFDMKAGQGEETIGARIARSIYEGLPQ